MSVEQAINCRTVPGELQETGVLQRIAQWAQLAPDDPALSDAHGRDTYTYGELLTAIRVQAQRIRDENEAVLGSGDRVLVVSDSSAQAYIMILACMWAGLVPAIAEADVPAATLQTYVEVVEPRVILRPQRRQILSPDACIAAADVPIFQPDRAQIMLFTSGTTGTPKAVVLPEKSFTAVPDLIRTAELDWITWTREDVAYAPLPSSHIGGLWWVFNSLAAGCHAVTGSSYDLVSTMAAWQVTITCMVPTLLGIIAEAVSGDAQLPSSLRLIVYGGSRAVSKDVRAIEHRGVRTAQIYGLSETGCTALCLPTQKDVAGTGKSSLELIVDGCVGQPYPGVQLYVVEDSQAFPADTRDLQEDFSGLHPGSEDEGTLWIRTPARMLHYHGDAEKTASVLRDGWINTGDRVRVKKLPGSNTPLVYLRGRSSDLIICGGANVNPDDVDSLALTIPGVADAAAFAVPDDAFGELVGLAIVPADDPPESVPAQDGQHRALIRRVAKEFRLTVSKEARPAVMWTVDEIPRTASGKVTRKELTHHWMERKQRD